MSVSRVSSSRCPTGGRQGSYGSKRASSLVPQKSCSAATQPAQGGGVLCFGTARRTAWSAHGRERDGMKGSVPSGARTPRLGPLLSRGGHDFWRGGSGRSRGRITPVLKPKPHCFHELLMSVFSRQRRPRICFPPLSEHLWVTAGLSHGTGEKMTFRLSAGQDSSELSSRPGG